MYTLCVIDVQNFFLAARFRELVNNVKKEIIKAKKKNYPIIYVKYDLDHWTANQWSKSLVKGVRSITNNYKQAFTLIKENDDGGDILYSFLKQKGLENTKIRAVGVNSSICVYYTVQTLAVKYNMKVDVASKACAAEDIKEHRMALDEMRFFKNIRVL